MKRRIHSRLVVVVLAVVVALGQADQAKAGPITDPAGDFNSPFYNGTVTTPGALDVISAGGTFDGTTFRLFATLNGPVAGAPANYVWGIQTGPRPLPGPFNDVGNPNVVFNRVFTLNATTGIASAGTVGTISGNDISISIPLSLLLQQPTAFAPRDFLWNLWPRDTRLPNNNLQISDFAPNNAVAAFDVIPEPATLAVFGGIALAGALGYRRRKVKVAA